MPIHPPPHHHDRHLPLSGKHAVVTGATSGIGRAIATEFARRGAAVVVHGRDAGRAEEVCRTLRGLSDAEPTSFLADLADRREREQLLEFAWNWQPVDIWVNVAGTDVLTGEAAEWSFEEKLDRLWQVDVRGTILLSREVGRRMLQSPQRDAAKSIVHVGWDQAETGMAGDPGEMFGPIKAAVMAFAKSQAQTLAPHVRVNCVAPGWIQTAWGEEASEYWDQRAKREALRGRWGTPADVASTVAFVVSDEADFLNGQVIPVNGGFRHGGS